MIQQTWGRHRTLILYTVIGASGVLLDLILFLIFYNVLGIDKNVSTFLSISAAITNNFFWNSFANFKTRDRLLQRYGQFYLVGLSGIVLTIIIFKIFVDWVGFDANIIKVGSLLPVLLLQYGLNKNWTFKGGPNG